jgi:hypothetical protein
LIDELLRQFAHFGEVILIRWVRALWPRVQQSSTCYTEKPDLVTD